MKRFSRRTSSFGIGSIFEGINFSNNVKTLEIHECCLLGDVEGVKGCIKRSKDELNMKSKQLQNNTPLHVACEHNNVEVVAFLMKKKCLTDCVNDFGNSPLHIACEKGYSQIVKTLLQNKLDLDLVNKYNQTPLHVRSGFQLTKFLLDCL
jgi:ankyrin repeat protein